MGLCAGQLPTHGGPGSLPWQARGKAGHREQSPSRPQPAPNVQTNPLRQPPAKLRKAHRNTSLGLRQQHELGHTCGNRQDKHSKLQVHHEPVTPGNRQDKHSNLAEARRFNQFGRSPPSQSVRPKPAVSISLAEARRFNQRRRGKQVEIKQ